jgi:ribosome-binding factor A
MKPIISSCIRCKLLSSSYTKSINPLILSTSFQRCLFSTINSKKPLNSSSAAPPTTNDSKSSSKLYESIGSNMDLNDLGLDELAMRAALEDRTKEGKGYRSVTNLTENIKKIVNEELIRDAKDITSYYSADIPSLLSKHLADVRQVGFQIHHIRLAADLNVVTVAWTLKDDQIHEKFSVTSAKLRSAIEKTLARSVNSIRYQIGKQINLKYVPEVRFAFDSLHKKLNQKQAQLNEFYSDLDEILAQDNVDLSTIQQQIRQEEEQNAENSEENSAGEGEEGESYDSKEQIDPQRAIFDDDEELAATRVVSRLKLNLSNFSTPIDAVAASLDSKAFFSRPQLKRKLTLRQRKEAQLHRKQASAQQTVNFSVKSKKSAAILHERQQQFAQNYSPIMGMGNNQSKSKRNGGIKNAPNSFAQMAKGERLTADMIRKLKKNRLD